MTSPETTQPPEPTTVGAAPAAARWFGPGVLLAGLLGLLVRFANVLGIRQSAASCLDPAGARDYDSCREIGGDALYTHVQSELLAQGEWFASGVQYWAFGDLQPGAGDPPLYVIYLGLVSALHGSAGLGAQLVGGLVVAGLVVLTWWALRRWVGSRAARLGLVIAVVGGTVLVAAAIVPALGADQVGIAPGGGDIQTLPGNEPVSTAATFDVSAYTSHRLASGLLGAAGVVLIGLVGRLVAGSRTGLIAAAFAAVYPMLWINDGMVLSESMYVPLVCLVMLAAYHFWNDPSTWSSVILGVAIAAAALTRAEAMLLFVALVVPLAWGRRGSLGTERAAGLVVICGLVGLLLFAPWWGWNMARFDEPALMTSQTGAVLSAGSCDVAYEGGQVGYYAANCFQQYVDQGWVEWPDVRADESVRDIPSREGAVRYIEENIEELPRVMAFRIGRMWDVYKPAQNTRLNYQIEDRGRWPSVVGLGMYYALAVLAVFGLWQLWRRRIPISPLVSMAIVVTVTAAMTFGVTRYRVPADVSLVIAAAVGVDAMLRGRWPADDGRVDGRVRKLEPGAAPIGAEVGTR